ncbi:MAG TPA: hypothetical protein PLV91_07600 [Verrucomicrobiota bacterium]|nr:hypothetical protein [Verrucomicrobiota bacterium]
MMLHFFVNFLISFVLIKLNSVSSELWKDILLKSAITPYLIEKYWPLFIICGVLLPAFYGVLLKKIKVKIGKI